MRRPTTLITPQETRVSRATHRSLGLNALLDRVRRDQTYSILDLGPALEANVRFWSQFSCRLHIRDFYSSYRERKTAVPRQDESEDAALSVLLPFDNATVFDIILAWDLFNYLDLRELDRLVQRLCRWCRPGTRVFVLISSLPQISRSPTLFRILDREQIIYEIPTPDTKTCPRYEPRDIAKVMARFSVSSSFVLHHGIREYVFAFK